MKRRKAGKQLKTSEPKARPQAAETVVFDQGKEVRAIARERLGKVKAGRVIEPKGAAKKPKHKKPAGEEE